jgi:hypothetical protein
VTATRTLARTAVAVNGPDSGLGIGLPRGGGSSALVSSPLPQVTADS